MTEFPSTSPPLPAQQRDYWCFISYRHADNKEQGRQWATWLHHALETYEVPEDLVGTRNERADEIPARIYPVFRDEEELPADAHLSEPIDRALRSSRVMVVICSPSALNSKFIDDEIRIFKTLGKSDRVLAMIIRGEPNASEDEGKQRDGVTRQDECFPLSLRRRYDVDGCITDERTEPVAADFRLEGGAEGWTSPEAYRHALQAAGVLRAEVREKVDAYAQRCELMKLKIIAGILGVTLGILTDREKAYQLQQARKHARNLQRWLAAVSVAMCLAIGAGTIAVYQWRQATLSTQRAVAARNQAEQLVQFMTFNLRDKLAPIGRLDLMQDIIKAVENYDAARDKADAKGGEKRSGNELHRRAVNLETQGDTLMFLGNLSEAEKCYRRAMEIAESLVARDQNNTEWQRDLSVRHSKLGDLMTATGNLPEAGMHYRKALKITESLTARNKGNAQWQSDLSMSHFQLGVWMAATGNLPEAEKHYLKALVIEENLAARDKKNTDWQYALSCSHERLGDLMTDMHNLPEAEKHYRKALEITDSLAARDKKNAKWQRTLSVSHEKLGDLMTAMGNLPEAETHYLKALEIRESLVARDKNNTDWQRDLCVSHNKLGILMKATGNLPEAETHYRRALEIAEYLAARDKSNAQWRRDLFCSLERLGGFMKDTGNLPEAEKHFRKALEIAESLAARDKKNADWQSAVCWYAALAGQFPEALAAGEKAVSLRLEGNPSSARMNLAHAYLLNGQFEKAKAIYCKYRGQALEDGRKWNEVVRDDFKTLRAAGHDHPDMKKIETLLQEPNSEPKPAPQSAKIP